MDGAQLVVSLVSGGLAGGSVSTVVNRMAYWRSLRTQFYPKLNQFFVAYVLRMQTPEGRYWEGTVGYLPAPDDKEFVEQRSQFISDLIQFNELREARELRRSIVGNPNLEGSGKMGDHYKVDLMPEYQAIDKCFNTVHDKLKL